MVQSKHEDIEREPELSGRWRRARGSEVDFTREADTWTARFLGEASPQVIRGLRWASAQRQWVGGRLSVSGQAGGSLDCLVDEVGSAKLRLRIGVGPFQVQEVLVR